MGINTGAIVTDAMTNVIEDASVGLWKKVKKFFKDLDNQKEIDFGLAYERYINRTKEKNSKIKTLIYRHVPQDLYSFYECVGIEYGGQTINTEDVNNILALGNKIIISGTGGMGKSTMLKHLFLNCIEKTDLIPVMIELRSLNALESGEINLYDIIYKTLVDNGFQLEKEYFEYSMNRGGYLILLDGYDEVKRDKVMKLSSEIRSLADKYSENKYIVSSRPSDDFIGWNDFAEAESMQLNKQQALSLIEKLDFDENVKKKFYKELDNVLYEKYESFASNPLLLTIMLLTYDSRASIPDKLNDFYEEAFATLFNIHDATKDSFVRDIRSGLGCEDFKLIFAYFCFKTYFSYEYEFRESVLRKRIEDGAKKFPRIQFNIDHYIEDLIQSVCMMIKEGLNYRFSHRSFQEYFAAWYTCKLTDNEQTKLLTGWIKEGSAMMSDSYFSMLFDLQSEKVNRIIFCPGIRELKKLRDERGFSISFLEELFEYVRIEKGKWGNEGYRYYYSFSVGQTGDMYLFEIFKMVCELNAYKRTVINGRKEHSVIKKYFEEKEDCIGKNFEISAILTIVPEEEFIKSISWVEDRLEFCFKILEEYGENKLRNKRKVSSILEEL